MVEVEEVLQEKIYVNKNLKAKYRTIISRAGCTSNNERGKQGEE